MSKENVFPQIAPKQEVGPVVRITTSYGVAMVILQLSYLKKKPL